MVEQKPKQKPVTLAPDPLTVAVGKKEDSPAAEFAKWCTDSLDPWNNKIDVPVFSTFLKDVDSPHEVREYVKCYLGETKDAKEFARQFLERRSKLLRIGIDTHSDDLSAPAAAVNPRMVSKSDYQQDWKGKGKGKKSKKNKMTKVDAGILGFSVTASEDRINVGNIDTGRSRRFFQAPAAQSTSKQ